MAGSLGQWVQGGIRLLCMQRQTRFFRDEFHEVGKKRRVFTGSETLLRDMF